MKNNMRMVARDVIRGLAYGIFALLTIATSMYLISPTRLVISYADRDGFHLERITELALRRELALLSNGASRGECNPDSYRLVAALIYRNLKNEDSFLALMSRATDLSLKATCLPAKEKYLSANLMASLARDRTSTILADQYLAQARMWSAAWQKELEAGNLQAGKDNDVGRSSGARERLIAPKNQVSEKN